MFSRLILSIARQGFGSLGAASLLRWVFPVYTALWAEGGARHHQSYKVIYRRENRPALSIVCLIWWGGLNWVTTCLNPCREPQGTCMSTHQLNQRNCAWGQTVKGMGADTELCKEVHGIIYSGDPRALFRHALSSCGPRIWLYTF